MQKLSQEEFCKAILACQNDDMITETGVLCLKIQETYQTQNEALVIFIPNLKLMIFNWWNNTIYIAIAMSFLYILAVIYTII